MAKQPKPKMKTAPVTERSKTGIRHRKNPQDPMALVRMGKGVYVNIGKPAK